MNILRRGSNKNAAKQETTSYQQSISVLQRVGLEAGMQALIKFIAEERLVNITIMEIEGGIVVQGVTDADTEYGQVTFLQTHVISEQDLRSKIQQYKIAVSTKPR